MEAQGIRALSSALAVAIAQDVSPASSQPSIAIAQSPAITSSPTTTPSNSAGNARAASGNAPNRYGLYTHI